MNNLAAAVSFVMLSPSVQTETVVGPAINLKASNFMGHVRVTQDVGAITGTLNGKIQDSADGSTDWADLAGAAFAEVDAPSNMQSISIVAEGTRGYIRYVGTIVTGPCAVNVLGTGTPKYV